MAQVIPLNSEGSRRISVDLGYGVGVITFSTRFNATVPGWYLDLFDADGTPLVYGLRLVAAHNIIRHLPRLTQRIGQLRVVDLDGVDNIDPDRLGVGVGLVHFLPGEFEASYPDPDADLRAVGVDVGSLFPEAAP